jgi:hypothetical protein
MVGQNKKCGVGIAFNAKIGGHSMEFHNFDIFDILMGSQSVNFRK